MYRFFHFDLSAWRCKKWIFLLACAWFLGLVSGVLFSMSASGVIGSAMRAALRSRVSIIGLLSAMLLPLLLSAFAVYIGAPAFLLPIVFVKAFLIAWMGAGILSAFGSAGWLIRILLMFGDSLSLPFLWWYWQKATAELHSWRHCILVAVCMLSIGCLDYYVVSPFLVNLIS